MLNSGMCNVGKYSKAKLFCSWTNPGFMTFIVLVLKPAANDNHNTDFIPSVISTH